MIDPVRFKKVLVWILFVLIIVEFFGALLNGLRHGEWGRMMVLAVVFLVAYVMWGKIMSIVRGKKDELKQRIQSRSHEVGLWDALIFSLLWSDEIYTDIPADRKRLVVIAYTLIALGLVIMFLGSGLLRVVVAGGFVLAAVNLVTWVASLERSARDAMHTELRLAREVQMSLLPSRPPPIAGYDVAARTIPAQAVGGDYYDFIRASENSLALCIGDVSGKGLPAALLMANLQATLRSQTFLNAPAKECVTRANHLLYQSTSPEKFATLFYALFDVSGGYLQYCNAGHPPPYLCSPDGSFTRLTSGGTVLGIEEDYEFDHSTAALSPGSLLVLYSDGITEAIDEQEQEFGEDRLADLIKQHRRLAANHLIEAILTEVWSFCGNAGQSDDMTLMVVKRLPGEAGKLLDVPLR